MCTHKLVSQIIQKLDSTWGSSAVQMHLLNGQGCSQGDAVEQRPQGALCLRLEGKQIKAPEMTWLGHSAHHVQSKGLLLV